MMKKVLYGVALALFASVSVGSLQSCKDDLNDFKTSTSYDLAKLDSDLRNKLQDLSDNTAENLKKKADIAYVQAEIGRIDSEIGGIKNDISGINSDIAGLKAADIEQASKIQGALDRLDGIDALINVGEISLKDYVIGELGAMQAEIDSLKTVVTDNNESLEALIRETQQAIFQESSRLKEEIDGELDVIREDVLKIGTAIDAIVNQIDRQVTGLLIQGVKSPVFGDFRLPIGIQSNILFNWYGYNDFDKSIPFPSNNKNLNVNGDPNLDLVALKLNPEGAVNIESGYYPEIKLGKVYVTVNPVGAKFDNLELSIEPSAGDPLPLTVTLTPSEEVLYHGYSRAVENGFYEGDVVLTDVEENIDAIRVSIDENLKSSMKDALKDPSKRTAAALLKSVYDNLSGVLPAYALRYDWTTGAVPSLEEDNMDPGFSQKANAVLSQYDLAVATAKPLSFAFLADKSFSHKLPILSPIDNFIQKLIDNGDLSLDVKDIKVKDANIKIGKITITTNVQIKEKNITIKLPEITAYDKDNNPVTVKYKDGKDVITLTPENELKDMYAAIKESITTALNNIQGDVNTWTDKLQKDINDQLDEILGDVQTQLNDMIDDINGQIKDKVQNIANKFQGAFDKVNKAFNIYNKIAHKVNNFLSDPNAYLQVTALYGMNGNDYGFLSNNANNPTTFTQAGGDVFSVFLTSYTGELIVPSYKKYVAVTGVKGDDNRTLAEINAAAGEKFNVVLDGNEIEIFANASAFKSGNVYEFTYQAMDHSVHTSTTKFYIQVK